MKGDLIYGKKCDIFERSIPKTNTLEMWEKHDFIDSAFVELHRIVRMDGENKIIIDMQYPKLGMKNAIDRCLIRKEALERLLIACTYLPQGLAFKIWDIYRTGLFKMSFIMLTNQI